MWFAKKDKLKVQKQLLWRVSTDAVNAVQYQPNPVGNTSEAQAHKKPGESVINFEKSSSNTPILILKHDSRQFVNCSMNISPIQPNPFGRNNPLLCGFYTKPRRAKECSHHPPIASTAIENYNMDYLDDILTNSKIKEQQFVLPDDFLQAFNHTAKNRMQLVNWMFNVQYVFLLSSSEYYTSVAILDQILSKIEIPISMYQLVGSVCIWISNKFIGGNTFKLDSVMNITSNAYAEFQAISMEIKLLKLLDYRIPSFDLSLFINAYTHMLGIERGTIIYWSIYFVSDCTVHLEEFSTIPCSFVAISCIIIALVLFHKSLIECVKSYFAMSLTRREKDLCNRCQMLIVSQIRRMKADGIAPIILNKYKKCGWIMPKITRMCNRTFTA